MNKQHISEEALVNENWSSDRIKELTLGKIHSSTVYAKPRALPRSFAKRFAIAAVVTVLIAFSGLAFATYSNRDLGNIFNTFFNNPSVDHKIDIEQTVSAGGLEITLLSAFCDSNRAYMMVEIKDIEGDRLSDTMVVVSQFSGGLGVERVVYDDSEDKATMILSQEFPSGISKSEVINIKIAAVFSDFIGELEYVDFDFENYDDMDWLMYFNGNRYEHTILGPWEMSFTVNAELSSKTLAAVPADSPYLAKIEISCSPMSTTIDMHSHRLVNGELIDPGTVILQSDDTEAIAAWQRYVDELDAYTLGMRDYIDSFGAPYLTFKDGSTAILLVLYKAAYGCGDGQAIYSGDYFDIEQLHSITFCGEEYIFDSVAR